MFTPRITFSLPLYSVSLPKCQLNDLEVAYGKGCRIPCRQSTPLCEVGGVWHLHIELRFIGGPIRGDKLWRCAHDDRLQHR